MFLYSWQELDVGATYYIFTVFLKEKSYLCTRMGITTVILLPAHPASFVHKFLFQRVPSSPGMLRYYRLVIKNSVLDS